MAKGTIKTIIADKGFGFITPVNARPGDKDIFFHFSGLAGGLRLESLHQGDEVEFETEEGQRGINAKNVRLATEGEAEVVETESEVDEVADESEEVEETETEDLETEETEESTETEEEEDESSEE